MRDLFGRLQRELEVLRRLSTPTLEDLLVRRAIERVVDLDRREALGVVGQHLRGGERLRVEAPLPFRVVVSGGSDPDGHTRTHEIEDLPSVYGEFDPHK